MIPSAHAVDFSNSTVNPAAKVSSIATLMDVIAPIAMVIGAFICLAMLIWGGFTYLTSAGEPDKLQQGKRTLTYAIIGVILMISAVLLVNLITYILGVNSFFTK